MKRSKAVKTAGLTAAALAAALSLQAQEVTGSTPTPVSLQQTIEAALLNNVSSRLAEAENDAARARTLEAASELLPSVLGTASQSRIFRENLAAQGLSGGPIPSLIGPFNSFDARFRLTQTLFDFSSIRRYQAADAGKTLAVRQEGLAREQVASAAALSYIEALRAQKAVAAAQADVDLAASLLSLAQDQHKNGTATGLDVVRAKTRASDTRVALLRAEVNGRAALLRLKRVAGWPLERALSLSDDFKSGGAPLPPLAQSLAQASGARPEIGAAEEKLKVDALLLGAAQGERAPSIVGHADYGLSGNRPDGGARSTSSIGAGLSIPLFAGGLIQGRVDEAKSRKKSSEVLLADVRAQVEEDVRLAYETVSEAVEEVQDAAQTVTLAEQELKMAQDRYAAGTGDNVEVVTAQTELAQARNGRVSSLAGEQAARVNLAAALGSARKFSL